MNRWQANPVHTAPAKKLSRLIVGVGNVFRSDDGVGPRAAQALQQRLLNVPILVCDGQAIDLLTGWNADTVILIDAMHSGAPAGTIYRFEIPGDLIPADCHLASTHGFGPAEAIALGAALDQLPPRLIIYAVEGATYSEGCGLSAVVEKSVDRVVDRVVTEFAACSRRS
jgi:hydrogenase maturation protease